jgi:hypothetical protein
MVEVSTSRVQLVVVAILLGLGALAVVTIFYYMIQEEVEPIGGLWRCPPSLLMVFVAMLTVGAPLAIARWRNLDRRVLDGVCPVLVACSSRRLLPTGSTEINI